MNPTTITFLTVLFNTATAMDTVFGGCKYTALGVTPWYNCNAYNGGKDPCMEQQSCIEACGRAGSQDTAADFVMVADYNGPSLGTCECYCYLK